MGRNRTEYTHQYALDHKHPCMDCGKPCSQGSVRCNSCQLKRRWIIKPITNPVFFGKGINHYNWKGGRVKMGGGYIGIRNPNHPRATNGYVLEHILIWEKEHDKPLPKGWIIHHLNGNKTDNRIVNLAALPVRKHYLVLQAKAKRIQELEALLQGQPQLV